MFPETLIPVDPSAPLQFLLAAGVALAAAAPIGPVSLLTIQRAMSLGFWRSFLPTLGAVTAAGIFGIIAALGSGYVTETIMGGRLWLRLVGSAILLAMGTRMITRRSIKGEQDLPVIREDFGSAQLALLNFTLVLSNPLTLAFHLAAFAVLGLRSPHLFNGQSIILGGGIFSGSLTWFLFICAAAGRFHLRIGDALLDRIRQGVGILFIILGILSAVFAVITE